MKGWKALGVAGSVALALMSALAAPVAFADEDERVLTYRGGDQEFTVAGSALFSQAESHLPGDALMGSVFVENDSDVACEVLTATKNVVADGPEDMLARIVYAVNREDGEPLYEGFLADAESVEPVSLGILEPGETMTAEYRVGIPADLTNEYADAAVGMNVSVSMVGQPVDDATDPVQTGLKTNSGWGTDGGWSGNGNGGGGDAAGAGAPTKGVGWGTALLQTGDLLLAVPFILGVLAAAGTVIWCAWKRRTNMW